MKTSNKLLLTILGVLVGSLLTYDIALKAEYRTGSYKDEFRDFKALVITGFDEVQVTDPNVNVKLTPGKFGVRINKHSAEYIQVKQVGRRLVVTANFPRTSEGGVRMSSRGDNTVLISCPDLRAFTTAGAWAEVSGFALDSLTVRQDRQSEVEMAGNKIGYLRATAGLSPGSECTLKITQANQIQAADLAIQNKSELVVENVFIPKLTCQFSDSASASISGRALGMMQR